MDLGFREIGGLDQVAAVEVVDTAGIWSCQDLQMVVGWV